MAAPMRLFSSHLLCTNPTQILSCAQKLCLSCNTGRTSLLLSSRCNQRHYKHTCITGDARSFQIHTGRAGCVSRKVHGPAKTAATNRNDWISYRKSDKSTAQFADELDQSEFEEVDELIDAHSVQFSSDNDLTKNGVFVEGDSKKAGITHRKRVEKEAMRENADTSNAAVAAARIRHQLKEERKGVISDQESDPAKKNPSSRTLRHQTQDLSKLQPSTVAAILKKCVIYNQGDVVAIDKPYGLPSHGGPGVTHNIDGLLPLLARNLSHKPDDNTTLHLVHRLDKETTGVMLLAKTEVMLRRLQAMFRNRKVTKKYWVLTVGVPDPPSGVIDMSMAEAEIAGSYRMVVKPDLSKVYPGMKRRRAPATEAVTKYNVLDSSKKGALVELEAMTGVKHQIRVHLAQGMACPILGDHKYSHYNKLAPQKLPISMLERLAITQQKVRTVPMHLHAQSLVIPEFFEDGRNLHVSTKLPKFFATNMRKLKLKVPGDAGRR